MSLKPLILIFLESATPTVTPVTPDLNSVIVGPAYDVLDYEDDGSALVLPDTYGDADANPTTYTPPATVSAVALTVLEGGYPGQSAGSRIDHTSVRVHFREPRVILGTTISTYTDAPVLGAGITTSSSDRTLITLTTPSVNFLTAGIQPGDRLILVSSAGQLVVRTVASVGEPNGDGLVASGNESKLRVTQELPASGVASTQWTYNSTGEMRVERVLPTQQLLNSLHLSFPEPGSDKFQLLGGVTLSLTLTPRPSVATPAPTSSSVTRPLSYADVALSYCALRQDLQRVGRSVATDLVTVNGVPTVRGVGKIDARNPLAVGLRLALENSGQAPIYYWGVASNDSTGYANARARMASRGDLYAFVPLTQDINVIGGYKSAFEQQASPLYARDRGVMQRFRIVLGSLALPTTETIYEGSVSGIAHAVTGAETGRYRTFRIDNGSTPTPAVTGIAEAELGVASVLPGDIITFGLAASGGSDWQNRRGAHRVGHVNTSFDSGVTDTELEVVPNGTRWDDDAAAASDDVEFTITSPSGALKAWSYASVAIATGTGGTLGSIRYTRKALTLVGGPYTIAYVSSGVANNAATFSVAGFAITMTLGTAITHTELAAAVNADSTLSVLLGASVVSGGSQAVIPASQDPVAPTSILPDAAACTAEIDVNDALYNELEDASASFLANVLPGDIVEIPVDPNNYGTDAFSGRLYRYVVATILNDNRLRIVNGFDDDADVARELPHFYMREYASRLVDNTTPNAISFRVRRTLTDDETVIAATARAQSVRSKRATLIFPDLVGVSDLRDGSLPRTTPTVRSLAGLLPSYYLACAVAGVIAGTPCQMGLTGGTFIGIDRLTNATDRFSEEQLADISDGGYFVCTIETEGALPECLHQLTTDPTALETGELSVVKNLDFLAISFQATFKSFLGKFNMIPEALGAVQEGMQNLMTLLRGRYVANIGAPLLSGTITSLGPSSVSADTGEAYIDVRVARPFNNLNLHLVVQQ